MNPTSLTADCGPCGGTGLSPYRCVQGGKDHPHCWICHGSGVVTTAYVTHILAVKAAMRRLFPLPITITTAV